VEHDPAWYEILRSRVTRAAVYLLPKDSYAGRIDAFPSESFDVITVDGIDRWSCFSRAYERLKRGGILIIDNTDKDRTTFGELYELDRHLLTTRNYEVRRFLGWAPGVFFAQETTICIKL
jgi:hypothetical protein